MPSRPYHGRWMVFHNIISELEKITGDKKIKQIKEDLELASLELEVEKYDEWIASPTDICENIEDKEIKEQVKDACKLIKDLNKAIRTRISPTSGEKLPRPTEENNYSQYGNKIIMNYRHNWHQLNKYLAIVYLLKEDLIDLDTFNHLRKMLVVDKIGGFNKRRRETRKNKSKRKKPKNKSKSKKHKKKSTRKTKH